MELHEFNSALEADFEDDIANEFFNTLQY